MSHPAEYDKILDLETGRPGIRSEEYARAIVRAVKESAWELKRFRDTTKRRVWSRDLLNRPMVGPKENAPSLNRLSLAKGSMRL